MKVKSSLKIGFKIFQLLFFLLLLVHWIGCIWYMLRLAAHAGKEV